MAINHSSLPRFQLSSTQTALCLIPPPEFHQQIDAIRSIHDRAYRKWRPHINIFYPFVESSLLPLAVETIRSSLRGAGERKAHVSLHEVGHFEHRKNATVFLKPNRTSEQDIVRLRTILSNALGCSPSQGTRDGEYRPHLTLGQSDIQAQAIKSLSDKSMSLLPIEWTASRLVALKREPHGAMAIVDKIEMTELHELNHDSQDRPAQWKNCYSFLNTWQELSEISQAPCVLEGLVIASYNLMSENNAPSQESRWPLIQKTVCALPAAKNGNPNVLCLQEVTQELLPLLLSDLAVRNLWAYSTHCPDSLLASHRNIVTLSSVPFQYHLLHLKERHKTSLQIKFPGFGVVVGNVHLTSGLSNEAVSIKMAQMALITGWQKKQGCQWGFLAGDFNLTTSSSTIRTALSRNVISTSTADDLDRVIDQMVWNDAFEIAGTSGHWDSTDDVYPGEEGATFDRMNNPLAVVQEVVLDRRPQRYDRVLFRGIGLKVRSFEQFGLPEHGHCASDHYGILSKFSFNTNEKGCHAATTEIVDVVVDSTDIKGVIRKYLPTEEDEDRRRLAVESLNEILSGTERLSDLILAPLGSYAMGTYFPTSDVDLLAIASICPQDFFDVALERLKRSGSGGREGSRERTISLQGIHFINSLVPIIETVVLGIKIDIQYCQAPELLQRFRCSSSRLSTLALDSPFIDSLTPSSLRPLNTYRDTAYIISTVPQVDVFREAHRYLSLFLKRRGLYSAKFGYLGGIHLSLMLNRVVKLIASGTTPEKVTAATIIRSFLKYYAGFEWKTEVVSDPSRTGQNKPTRTHRDAIVIRAIFVPTARPNVASSCTKLSAQTISKEFALAAKHINEGDWEWCIRDQCHAVQDFLVAFGAYIRVRLTIWDLPALSAGVVRHMMGHVESKIPSLLVELGLITAVSARAWPGRFNDSEVDGKNELAVIYLIGVSAREEKADMQKLVTGKILEAGRKLERICRQTECVERGHGWVEVNLVSRRKIGEGRFILDEREFDALFEASVENEECAPQVEKTTNVPMRTSGPSNAGCSKKLRPAQDVINRLKWDPGSNTEDYLIGYEDRFLGVKELPLGKWKSDQTDDEFIPMHRVVWVRRRGAGDEGKEGEIVWDRKQRIDWIFGSGRKKC